MLENISSIQSRLLGDWLLLSSMADFASCSILNAMEQFTILVYRSRPTSQLRADCRYTVRTMEGVWSQNTSVSIFFSKKLASDLSIWSEFLCVSVSSCFVQCGSYRDQDTVIISRATPILSARLIISMIPDPKAISLGQEAWNCYRCLSSHICKQAFVECELYFLCHHDLLADLPIPS